MRYNINATLIYDASDGTLTLSGCTTPDSQLSITANVLLHFFLQNRHVVSREEVLKKVWDDNGLTSSNSNLNQYLSMLRKTFRHYDIDNIIVTVSRGNLQLNPDIILDVIDAQPEPAAEKSPQLAATVTADGHVRGMGKEIQKNHSPAVCWYLASACLLTIASLLVIVTLVAEPKISPITLKQFSHNQCEIQASEEMLRSLVTDTWRKNIERVRQRLNLNCKPGERFVFFYGDKLETDGLGRVFLARCATNDDNPFSYCDNYFYYSWKP